MPLPAALLAKLKKRGIVKGKDSHPDEEVIAESYDDDSSAVVQSIVGHGHLVKTGGSGAPNVAGCPNRSNPFHSCSSACRDKYGGGGGDKSYEKSHKAAEPKVDKIRLDPDMERRRKRMLKKYPLPGGWEEVLDRSTARYYYWNTANDQVSWLSPTHPRCGLSLSASKLLNVRADRLPPAIKPAMEMSKPRRSPPPSSQYESEDRSYGEPMAKKSRPRGEDRALQKANDLDPMDPAAYSEAPRGNWASGLEQEEDAITGVDVTASGPLFQMRPYPSPGAILKKNAKPAEKKEKDKNAKPIGPTM